MAVVAAGEVMRATIAQQTRSSRLAGFKYSQVVIAWLLLRRGTQQSIGHVACEIGIER
jgi:hypothetical protein